VEVAVVPKMIMHRLALVVLGVLAIPSNGWIVPSKHQLRLPTQLHFSNVVLRPSEDPNAFDSGKIGCARVHRYIREDESDAEYVMWYHGRSQEFPDDPNLPPLSTGRIGRAISQNGIKDCHVVLVCVHLGRIHFHNTLSPISFPQAFFGRSVWKVVNLKMCRMFLWV